MSDNLVKSLREKTEEADLDTILKTTLGGYTRKSVREYISILRRLQYDMQQSFSEELQLCQTERERLAWELEESKNQAAAAQEALEQAKPLMEKAAGLEKDMDEAVARIQSDAALLEQQTEELQRVKGELDTLQARLEEREAQLNALKQEAAASPVQPEVVSGDGPLLERPETMQVQLAMLTRERETHEKRMERVIRQEKRLFQALNECQTELESRRDQNLCMEAENKALSLRLSEQMWQNISLNREITHMRTMNENLKCKLEAALAQSANPAAQDGGDLFLWDFQD